MSSPPNKLRWEITVLAECSEQDVLAIIATITDIEGATVATTTGYADGKTYILEGGVGGDESAQL